MPKKTQLYTYAVESVTNQNRPPAYCRARSSKAAVAPPPLRPASSSHASTRTSKRPCVPAINAAVTELGWAGRVGAACVVVGWN